MKSSKVILLAAFYVFVAFCILRVIASTTHDVTYKSGRVNVEEDFLAIHQALERYEADNGRFPTTEQGLEALAENPTIAPIPKDWKGPYRYSKAVDPWGNPYRYRCPSKDNKKYDIWSMGPDRKDGTSDDIVYGQSGNLLDQVESLPKRVENYLLIGVMLAFFIWFICGGINIEQDQTVSPKPLILRLPIIMFAIFFLTSSLVNYSRDVIKETEIIPRRESANYHISELTKAVERYQSLSGYYPATEQGLEALQGLKALIKKPVVASDPQDWDRLYVYMKPIDPWGSLYRYRYPSTHNMKFDIWSLGPDGKEGTDDDVANWIPEKDTGFLDIYLPTSILLIIVIITILVSYYSSPKINYPAARPRRTTS